MDIIGGQTDGDELSRAILATLPDDEWERNRRVFDFVRELKAMPQFADAEPTQLDSIVERWHKEAGPFIETDFQETYNDFLVAWKNVKYEAGKGAIDRIWKEAKEMDPPPFALRYNPETRQLVNLCLRLQQIAGDRPFFLACRTVARLIGEHYTNSWRRLGFLVLDKVLLKFSQGSRATKKANEYIYVGRKDCPQIAA